MNVDRQLERREMILNMWASGARTREIADAVHAPCEDWIRAVVNRARAKGDKRAEQRRAGNKTDRQGRKFDAHIVPNAEVLRATPSHLGLTPFGILMGDPPAGRSALDRKRAGLPV